jgi:2-oxoacid:acceptor oxidoreductase delta subunit (pyruvate/2-ketoisovalerate family)
MKIKRGAVITEPGSSEKKHTGDWRTFRPVIDPAKCTACGICWLYCPEPAIAQGKPHSVDYNYCKGCGICARECPFKAIVMVREE